MNEMPWEDFERIQWRILRDVEGLRHAQIYGERGQRQKGLDVVALAPDGSGVALQSKRYARFGPANLRAAVRTFQTTRRPFDVDRLIIGVSREVKSTQSVEVLAELRRDLHPLALDVWDKRELSDLLRNAPAIVIEFFGLETAQRFCHPFELPRVVVPGTDAVKVREAIARTPEEVTGAAALLQSAHESGDHVRALELIASAQERLREARFHSYALKLEPVRTRHLVSLGRSEEALRQALDEFWRALEQGTTTTAHVAKQRVQEIAGDGRLGGAVSEFTRVAQTAADLYFNPLGYSPPANELEVGDDTDRLRIAVLAGETALANDNVEWLRSELPSFAPLTTTSAGTIGLRTRLRLLLAEAGDDWRDILTEARKLLLGHDLLALVTARYARSRALVQEFEEADALWDEATGDACLAERWVDATTWTLSRRVFRERWRPFTSNDLLALNTALHELGPTVRIIPIHEDAFEQAMEGLAAGRLRSAAIAAQRALRDAVTTGDWHAEGKARRVLASILTESDEPEIASRHLTRAAAVKQIEELAEAYPNRFIDATGDLDAPCYWTVATTYRLIAKQADIVPDDLIGLIAAGILADLEASERGDLIDMVATQSSRYLSAVHALAGIATRLTAASADRALSHFERQPTVERDHYRYHDDDEAVVAARIAETQAGLRSRAVAHLVALLDRSQSARTSMTVDVVDSFLDVAKEQLELLADEGSSWAQEILASRDPSDISPEVAAAAVDRLTSPLEHRPGVYTVGTRAVQDSILVGALKHGQLDPALAELLRRANDPHVGTSDRGEYLLAASNIARRLPVGARRRYYEDAMRCASSPKPSEHDEMSDRFNHKLGAVRMTGTRPDSRGKALFLAAQLATSSEQRSRIKDQAFALLGPDDGSDYWPTRALQLLGQAVNGEIGFLSAQGWGQRSLAAALWTENGDPLHVGISLARDRDVRVRRALADSLARSEIRPHQDEARNILKRDPAYSVRHALGRAIDS
ncbi:hypothetical protein ABE437_04835 [Isoptericola cucumis]|uniref:hypothetical protein n=1 Tax=Isoptericola cucumis TaxID=1776856 RepID=UPI00320A2625